MPGLPTKNNNTTLLGFVVGILAMILVGAFAFVSSSNFAASAKQSEQSQTVRSLLLELGQTGSRAKADNRSYILTGRKEFLDAFSTGEQHVNDLLQQIRTIRTDAETTQKLDEIKKGFDQRFAMLTESINIYRSKGMEAAVSFVKQSDDPAITMGNRKLISELEEAEAGRMASLAKQTEQNKAKTQILLPIGIGFAVLAVAVAAYMVQRDKLRRLVAEEELGRSLAEQRAILESAASAIFSFDKAGKISSYNKQAEKMLGYSAAEVVGKETPLLFLDPEDVNAKAKEYEVEPGLLVLTKPAKDRGGLDCECRFVRKDGSRIPVLLSVAPKKEGTEILGFVGIASDLSEAAEAREKVNQYVRELEETREDLADKNKLLEELAEDLKASRDEAIEATNAKSEFLANMSHEIRTPLNGVLGTTHLLLNTELSEKQRSYVQLIHRSAESLLSILNDILDLSKMEAGKMSLENEPFDLRETIEDVCEQFASVAHQKGLDLNLLVPPDSPVHVLGDSTRVRQVVTNLVANAIKFTSEGEVNVKADVVREDQGTVKFRVTVQDSGIGIPKAKLESIFESFIQADGATARRFGGTGLGLAISRQLIDLMHGEIGVDSEDGRGSEFWFEVTFERQTSEQIEAERKDLGGITVLLADGNNTSRTALRELLKSWNCNVESMDTEKEALEAISRGNYDCAIMDLEGRATEVARAARKSKKTRDLPLVLVSASYEIQNEAEATNLFQAVLSKPVRSSLLYESVARAVKMGVQADTKAGPTAQDQLRSVRVLVVEDNPINQLVVTEMLKGWGCTVVAVDNGKKAVDRLLVDNFEIVLMDVQMPEMDGLEATRVIRKREQHSQKHIPIVAMTANAMKGDEERCLEAGMDAYLAKPIQPQKLAETMAHYAGHEVEMVEDEAAPAMEIEQIEALPIFDLEQLNQTTSGKPELQQRILERYLESIGPQTAKLDDAIHLMEREQIKSIAHSLKGSSWTIGALSIADAFRRIETGSQTLSSGHLQELMSEVEEDVNTVKQRIQEHLREAAQA